MEGFYILKYGGGVVAWRADRETALALARILTCRTGVLHVIGDTVAALTWRSPYAG